MATYTVDLQPGQIAMAEGDDVMCFSDTFDAVLTNRSIALMPPIRRAVVVTRLRALADQIEKTGEYDAQPQ